MNLRPALTDPETVLVQGLIGELAGWPGPALSSHKSASQFFHKLAFLADLGFTWQDRGLEPVLAALLATRDEFGIPCLNMNTPVAYGGSGSIQPGWALCDAPTSLYALHRMGCQDASVVAAVDHLAALIQPFGFPCAGSAALGSWRGPGKKSEPCPYACLVMLKLLACFPDRYGPQIRRCANVLLDLWTDSRSRHPYMFFMGTDFRKLKFPCIWYDLVHVLEVLSRLPDFRRDARLLEMYRLALAKRGPAGYVPESVYLPFRDWDFGQKKLPSRWLTDCLDSIGQRLA